MEGGGAGRLRPAVKVGQESSGCISREPAVRPRCVRSWEGRGEPAAGLPRAPELRAPCALLRRGQVPVGSAPLPTSSRGTEGTAPTPRNFHACNFETPVYTIAAFLLPPQMSPVSFWSSVGAGDLLCKCLGASLCNVSCGYVMCSWHLGWSCTKRFPYFVYYTVI